MRQPGHSVALSGSAGLQDAAGKGPSASAVGNCNADLDREGQQQLLPPPAGNHRQQQQLLLSPPTNAVRAMSRAISQQSFSESYQTATRIAKDGDSPALSSEPLPTGMTATETDARLVEVESAVEHALNRAKVWSKYAKSIISYVDKRNSLESEFCRNLQKLALSCQAVILENDLGYCTISSGTSAIIQTRDFIEPLVQCRAEHDRQRRVVKELWFKTVKRESDAVSNMKKARSTYEQRWHDYEKAKETAAKGLAAVAGGGSSSASLAALPDALAGSGASAAAQKNSEKKKRLEEEAWHRTVEAEMAYKASVAEANARHLELIRTKGSVLQQIRELLLAGDERMKVATTSYFRSRRNLVKTVPEQLKLLFDICVAYPPGTQYEEFAADVLHRHSGEPCTPREPYSFEPYRPEGARGNAWRGASSTSGGSALPSLDSRSSLAADEATSPRLTPRSPASDDSDSDSSSSGGEKSHGFSPLTSPRLHQRTADVHAGDASRRKPMAGHALRKLRTPSRCRLCDSYVYFGGEECEKCGLVCHRKCLRSSTSQCSVQPPQPPRRMTTFGVDISEHVSASNVAVPVLITRCIEEIDKRGLQVKGIYRLSGVKSKVEKLCQSFENGKPSEVELSEHNPVVISNVLKLYLRQLPEPLLTSKLYSEFVGLVKEQPTDSNQSDEQATAVSRMCELLRQLPAANYATLRALVCHLWRVAYMSDVNQMSASNLGIVFGPTLLRQSAYDMDDVAPAAVFADTSYQTRAVELLVKNASVIFNYEEDMSGFLAAVDSPRSIRDRNSLSSDGADSNLSLPDSGLGNTGSTCLPEADGSIGDARDCNGNVFVHGATSSDALSDLCASADRLSISDGEYCEIAEGTFFPTSPGLFTVAVSDEPPEVSTRHSLPPLGVTYATADGVPSPEDRTPVRFALSATGPPVVCTVDDVTDGINSMHSGGFATEAGSAEVGIIAACLLDPVSPTEIGVTRESPVPPVPPPRPRRSLSRKVSHPSSLESARRPSIMRVGERSQLRLPRHSVGSSAYPSTAAAALLGEGAGMQLLPSSLSLHAGLRASTDSLSTSPGTLDVDTPLPSITRSRSMSRIVFYSDFDIVGPSSDILARDTGGGSPATSQTQRRAAPRASPAQRTRSMKRMSDTPHFV